MTTRFCPRCENDVHDAGGYCLLGHPLALEPLDASLGELRDEIDQAFEDARLEVAAVVSGTETTQPMRVLQRTASPPPPPPASVIAPAHPARVGPPPPPPPRKAPPTHRSAPEPTQAPTQRVVASTASVWKDLEKDVDITDDPIGSFAPPPHMDWGPQKNKNKILKRKPARHSNRPLTAE